LSLRMKPMSPSMAIEIRSLMSVIARFCALEMSGSDASRSEGGAGVSMKVPAAAERHRGCEGLAAPLRKGALRN
jgi:hypothetical protein